MATTAMVAPTKTLALVVQARKALSQARSFEQIKNVRDWAEAAKVGLKIKNESLVAQNALAAIRLQAERMLGQILNAMEKHKGGRPKNQSNTGIGFHAENGNCTKPQSIKEMGLDRHDNHRWRKLARVPEQKLAAAHAKADADEKELTTTSVLRLADEGKPRMRMVLNGAFKRIEDKPNGEDGWFGWFQRHLFAMGAAKIVLERTAPEHGEEFVVTVTGAYFNDGPPILIGEHQLLFEAMMLAAGNNLHRLCIGQCGKLKPMREFSSLEDSSEGLNRRCKECERDRLAAHKRFKQDS